jgi:protein tyrosine phosphatase
LHVNIHLKYYFLIKKKSDARLDLDMEPTLGASSSGPQEAKTWTHNNPKMTRVLQISGLILGSGLLISIPLKKSLRFDLKASLAIAGMTAITASLLPCFSKEEVLPPETNSSQNRAENSDVKVDRENINKIDSPHRESKEQLGEIPLFFSENEYHATTPMLCLWNDLGHKTADIKFCFTSKVESRFINVGCEESTAVKADSDDEYVAYLHANRVGQGLTTRKLIASQAPKPAEFPSFWKTIFEEEGTIIDLTQPGDLPQGEELYYPTSTGLPLQYGSIEITLLTEKNSVCTYKVKSGHQQKIITRYHYSDWKDGSEIAPDDLGNLIAKVNQLSPLDQLVWVHCRAGVGRTGTFISADILNRLIKSGKITEENVENYLLSIVATLRAQRCPLFVQTLGQLQSLRAFVRHRLSDMMPLVPSTSSRFLTRAKPRDW